MYSRIYVDKHLNLNRCEGVHSCIDIEKVLFGVQNIIAFNNYTFKYIEIGSKLREVKNFVRKLKCGVF